MLNLPSDITVFAEKLHYALELGLPGEAAQNMMSRFKRFPMEYYLQAFPDHRNGAVCILFFSDGRAIRTILILRSEYNGHHSAQPAFPGGKQDPGETLLQTAIRETREELGITVNPENIIGALSPLFIPVSKFMVQPFMAVLPAAPKIIADAREVQRVVEVELATLLDENCKALTKVNIADGVKVEAPCYKTEGLEIWGATAMMISELREVLIKTTF